MPSTFRAILHESYLRRRGRNPHYSLRAFARDLQLAPSSLCEILKGREALSRPKACRVSAHLGMNEAEREHFCDLVDAESARSPGVRAAARERIARRIECGAAKRLLDAEYAVIADWFHLALLEALSLTDTAPTAAGLGARLGLDEATAAAALRRLESVGLVAIRDDGVVEKRADDVQTSADVPSAAIRSHHEQMLDKAGTALHFEAVTRRTYESLILAFRQDRTAEAYAKIRAFVREFNAEFGRDAAPDSVYALTMQLFPLSPEVTRDR